LNFRTATLLLVLLLILLALVHSFVAPVSWGWYAGVVAAYVGLLAWGSARIGSGFYLKAQCRSNSATNAIAVTFDDGPHPEVTPEVLKVLKSAGAHATFFCIGKNMEGQEAVLQRMMAERHLVGNHAYSHSWGFDLLPAKAMIQEMERTNAVLQKATGRRSRLFRPPYGVTNPAMRRAVDQMGFSVIGWSVRSMDGGSRDAERIYQRIAKRLQPGDIILLHDTHRQVIPILQRLLHFAKEKRLRCVTVAELLEIEAYE